MECKIAVNMAESERMSKGKFIDIVLEQMTKELAKAMDDYDRAMRGLAQPDEEACRASCGKRCCANEEDYLVSVLDLMESFERWNADSDVWTPRRVRAFLMSQTEAL